MPDIVDLPDLPSDLDGFLSDFEKNYKYLDVTAFWGDKNNKDLARFKKIVKDHFFKIQDKHCIYCRQKINVKNNRAWDLEHVVSKFHKPAWTLKCNNLCLICIDCNTEKGDQNVLTNKSVNTIPKDSEKYIIYNPHLDNYTDHITVVSVGELYIPESKKGRKTFDICGFSRFLENLTGVGAKTNGNVLLMQKIVEMLVEETQPERIEKLNNLILILAKNNTKIIQEAKEGEIESILKKLTN